MHIQATGAVQDDGTGGYSNQSLQGWFMFFLRQCASIPERSSAKISKYYRKYSLILTNDRFVEWNDAVFKQKQYLLQTQMAF